MGTSYFFANSAGQSIMPHSYGGHDREEAFTKSIPNLLAFYYGVQNSPHEGWRVVSDLDSWPACLGESPRKKQDAANHDDDDVFSNLAINMTQEVDADRSKYFLKSCGGHFDELYAYPHISEIEALRPPPTFYFRPYLVNEDKGLFISLDKDFFSRMSVVVSLISGDKDQPFSAQSSLKPRPGLSSYQGMCWGGNRLFLCGKEEFLDSRRNALERFEASYDRIY